MNDEYQWWLAALLASAGATVLWLLYGKLPRREEDVETEERSAEARWISDRLNEVGERAPPEVVEQVLELHRTYLADPPARAPFGPDPVPPAPAGPEPVASDAREPTPGERELLESPRAR